METWLPYARSAILTSTEDDFRKRQHAWRLVGRRIRRDGPASRRALLFGEAAE